MLPNDMASLSKRPLSPLRVLFLCLVVFFGGIVVRAQEASVTPSPAGPKTGTQGDFIAAADEVLNQMSEITGLKLRAPLQKSLPFIKDALIFPYLGGLNFTAAVLKDTGWPGLPALFEKPPVSTQQILHPALYRSGKTPPNVTLPQLEKLLGANWSKLDENALGEFGWKEVLKQFLGEDRAKPMAAAWDGDRYVLYEQKQNKKLVLVTRLQLDSEEHAARFFGQYSEALEKKHSQRSNLFRRPSFFSFDTPEGGVFLDCFNKECVTLEGATRGVFDGLTKALGWPSAQQPPERPGAVSEKTATIFRRTEKSSIRHLDEPKTPSNLSLGFEEDRPHLAAFSGNGGVFALHHEKRQVVRLLDSFTEAAQIG